MNCQLGGVKIQLGLILCPRWLSLSSLPQHMTGVWGELFVTVLIPRINSWESWFIVNLRSGIRSLILYVEWKLCLFSYSILQTILQICCIILIHTWAASLCSTKRMGPSLTRSQDRLAFLSTWCGYVTLRPISWLGMGSQAWLALISVADLSAPAIPVNNTYKFPYRAPGSQDSPGFQKWQPWAPSSKNFPGFQESQPWASGSKDSPCFQEWQPLASGSKDSPGF